MVQRVLWDVTFRTLSSPSCYSYCAHYRLLFSLQQLFLSRCPIYGRDIAMCQRCVFLITLTSSACAYRRQPLTLLFVVCGIWVMNILNPRSFDRFTIFHITKRTLSTGMQWQITDQSCCTVWFLNSHSCSVWFYHNRQAGPHSRRHRTKQK